MSTIDHDLEMEAKNWEMEYEDKGWLLIPADGEMMESEGITKREMLFELADELGYKVCRYDEVLLVNVEVLR